MLGITSEQFLFLGSRFSVPPLACTHPPKILSSTQVKIVLDTTQESPGLLVSYFVALLAILRLLKSPHENHSMQSGHFFKLFKEGFILFLFLIKRSVAGAYHNIPFVDLPFIPDNKLSIGLSRLLFHLGSVCSNYPFMKSSVSLSHLLAKLVFIPCIIPVVQSHHVPAMQWSHSFVTADFPFLLFIVAHLVMKKNLRWGPVTPTSFCWHPSPAVTLDPLQCL